MAEPAREPPGGQPSPGSSSRLAWAQQRAGPEPGFYAGATPFALPNFCAWQPVSRDAGLLSGPSLGLAPTDQALWQAQGEAQTADRMAQVAMRDITRAGDFAETYDQNASPPQPSGVWPSVFGARMMIDAALWHNGIVADEGLPVLMGTQQGGVSNLRVRGETLSVSFNGEQVTLEGPALRRLLRPAIGAKVLRVPDGTLRWSGTIPGNSRVELRARD